MKLLCLLDRCDLSAFSNLDNIIESGLLDSSLQLSQRSGELAFNSRSDHRYDLLSTLEHLCNWE